MTLTRILLDSLLEICAECGNFTAPMKAAPEILAEAMTIGWKQNVVILESDLTLQEKAWYIQAVKQFGWSKLTLLEKIKAGAHAELSLDFQDEVCYCHWSGIRYSLRAFSRFHSLS